MKVEDKTDLINDPLGQTHNPAISDHYSHLKVVLFREFLKRGNGRTDDMYKNNYPYRP